MNSLHPKASFKTWDSQQNKSSRLSVFKAAPPHAPSPFGPLPLGRRNRRELPVKCIDENLQSLHDLLGQWNVALAGAKCRFSAPPPPPAPALCAEALQWVLPLASRLPRGPF